MNSPKICLILGAGASRPYGYPLGWQLKERIIQYCLSKPADCAPRTLIPETHQMLAEFARRFDADESATIDAFLTKLAGKGEHERKLNEHGRMAIVAVLSTYEYAETETKDWYDQIADLLQHENKSPILRVVTFNYDRSLEFLLSRAMEKRELSRQAARRMFQTLVQVTHVYDCVAELPFLSETSTNPLEYGEITGHGKWKGGLSRIKMIGEGRPDNADIAACKEWIEAADFVLVLGFGFDHTNLNLIGLNTLQAGKFLFCSGFKLTSEVRSRVRWSCMPAKVHFAPDTVDIATFLRTSSLLASPFNGETPDQAYARLGPGIS